jgi:hypothetical protein
MEVGCELERGKTEDGGCRGNTLFIYCTFMWLNPASADLTGAKKPIRNSPNWLKHMESTVGGSAIKRGR